jgi:hypothetical protein
MARIQAGCVGNSRQHGLANEDDEDPTDRPSVVSCGDGYPQCLFMRMPTKADFPRKKKRLPLAEQTIVEG